MRYILWLRWYAQPVFLLQRTSATKENRCSAQSLTAFQSGPFGTSHYFGFATYKDVEQDLLLTPAIQGSNLSSFWSTYGSCYWHLTIYFDVSNHFRIAATLCVTHRASVLRRSKVICSATTSPKPLSTQALIALTHSFVIWRTSSNR